MKPDIQDYLQTTRHTNLGVRIQTMPSRLARILIALVLALTVPIQGAAAATAGLCMVLGHHEAGFAGSHDHGAGAVHHQHHHTSTDKSAGGAHCPPCVACCAAAAISSLALIFAPEAPTVSAIAASEPLSPGIQPDKLDRPPLAL